MSIPQPAPHESQRDRAPKPAGVRLLGLGKALAGLATVGLYWPLGFMRLLERLMDAPSGSPSAWLGKGLMLVMSAPVVLFFIGAWELVSGRPFRLMESAWGRLKEWQQGALSFLLLCAAIGLLLLLLHLIFGLELF